MSHTIVVALLVSSCGRQVTPNPVGLGPGGAPIGYTAFSLTVAAPFDFSKYQYMFVLNTSGDGVTPSTDTFQTNWAGYKFALVALGNQATSSAEFIKFVSPIGGKGPPGWYAPHTTPQLFSYNLNSNGTDTQFTLLVKQSIFSGTPPSPSPSPAASWTFNVFTTQQSASQGQWHFLDSMGAGGPNDPQFVSPALCMTESFDEVKYAQDSYALPDPPAQIVSVEIANNPISPKPCP